MTEATEAQARALIRDAKTIAVVGASPNEGRASYDVTAYLARSGFTVFPINPGHAGKEIAGLMTYASLADVPEPVDIVDIFRAADAMPGVVDEVLTMNPLPKVVWMQLGLRNEAAAAAAEAAGITVVMDKCTKIEHGGYGR
jgi:uncharacterized protein